MVRTTLATKDWMRFCREFNAANRYRRARVAVEDSRQGRLWIERELPFLGLTIFTHRGAEERLMLTAAQYDPQRMCEWQVSVPGPVEFDIDAESGVDQQLCVLGSDDTRIEILFSQLPDPDPYRSLVEEVAHTLYERRGSHTGRELSDWLEAERRIKVAGCLLS